MTTPEEQDWNETMAADAREFMARVNRIKATANEAMKSMADLIDTHPDNERIDLYHEIALNCVTAARTIREDLDAGRN